jgi:hypothetical protein
MRLLFSNAPTDEANARTCSSSRRKPSARRVLTTYRGTDLSMLLRRLPPLSPPSTDRDTRPGSRFETNRRDSHAKLSRDSQNAC